jgi:hypothetical protein
VLAVGVNIRSNLEQPGAALGEKWAGALNIAWPEEFRAEQSQRGMSIMFQLRLAMIQTEPTMTRKTINTPKARATTLFV